MARKTYRLTAGAEDDGTRLDQFIARHQPELSRTLLRKVIDLGGVHVAGKRVRKCSFAVRRGQGVEVYIDGLPLEPFTLSDDHILHRDKYLLAINKPAGVDTQPTPSRYKGTLYDALLRFLQDPFRPKDRPSLGMVQRLDRDTSGVMVFSIHPSCHRALTESFVGRDVKKVYLALVAGSLQEKAGEFRSLLAKNRASNLVRSVARGGKEAITRYRVVEEFRGASLVEVELLTGRSHQIRAHFSEAGHPLLGDSRYGGPDQFVGRPVLRQMLHSRRLLLSHPRLQGPLDLEAPLPADMEKLLGLLRADPD